MATTSIDLKKLDDSHITREHWKIMFISGMGFFTDAYDLFIIGVAMKLIEQQWHVAPYQSGLVTSTALIAAAIGAFLFGRVADMLGRKRIYGYEVLVLAAGAVASAFSWDIWSLIVFRFILGVGIGGDYPVSSTIMSEYAGKRHRGMMVSLVFSMQAAGLIVGPALASILLWSGLNHSDTWRILLSAGAVPAMAVFWARRHLAETPRFRLAEEQRANGKKISFWEGFRFLWGRPYLRVRLIGAALTWFMMDFSYYGNTVSSPMVLNALSPRADLLHHTLVQLAIFVIAAAPGYFVAATFMDRMGRKSIQVLGFGMMTVSFAALALVPNIENLVYPFLFIYGLSYFFTEFGPNSTTFVYPAELFPVEGRTTGHGIAAGTAKIGGFVGVFTFPILMSWHGLLTAELGAALASLIGLGVTLGMLPETKGRSLEDLSADPAHANAARARMGDAD